MAVPGPLRTAREPQAAASLLAEISAARDRALAVLDGLSAQHVTGGRAVEAVVALQSAANQLGIAESAIAELRRVQVDEPAPIPDAEPAGATAAAMLWNGNAI